MSAQTASGKSTGFWKLPSMFFSRRVSRQVENKLDDRDQVESLILEHMDYARQIVSSFLATLPADVDRENLLAAGLLGLTEAAHQFDPEQGAQFKTFAYSRVRGAVIDELRRNSPLPQRMLRDIASIRQVMDKMESPRNLQSIQEQTGIDVDRIEECLEGIRIGSPQNWDDMNGAVPDSRTALNPELALAHAETISELNECIGRLPDRENAVIHLYHSKSLRLKEIGDILGLSESRVSRILDRAEQRIREMMGEMMGEMSG